MSDNIRPALYGARYEAFVANRMDAPVGPATGAYNYSMANNCNRVPRPPVVMVDNGNATEIVRRETYDDLLRLDHRLPAS